MQPAVQTALITGGSRGIGAAAVRAFAAAGYRVAFCYVQNGKAARTLQNEFPAVRAYQADVADPAQVNALFAEVQRDLGAVDVLICNAGVAQQKLFGDITPQEWKRMLDVHMSGAFYCCQAALPHMLHQKWGRILTVSSMWGQIGGSCEVHYSAAKAGLIGLTRALAKEVGPSGITVNCVAPGVIDTDMMSGFTPQEKADLAQDTPVGRLGRPEELADALLFLASDKAGYITGQVLGQNGGLAV